MNKKKNKTPYEPWLFGVLLLLSLTPLFFSRWALSLEGPLQLYHAQLLSGFIFDHTPAGAYYELHWLTPGLSIGIILSIFKLALPAWLAEKFLLGLLLILFPISIRYLVFSQRKGAGILHFLAFPLAWNFPLMMGAYGYMLALSSGFFLLGMFLRFEGYPGLKRLFLFGGLLLLLLFSNAFVFILFFLLFLLISGMKFLIVRRNTQGNTVRQIMQEPGPVFLAFLPSVALFAWMVPGLAGDMPGWTALAERFQWLVLTRPLVIYSWDTEWPMALVFTASLLLPTGWLIWQRWTSGPGRKTEPGGRILLYASLLCLALFFATPESSKGLFMQSGVRLLLVFNALFVAWLAVQGMQKLIQFIAVGLSLLSLVLLSLVHINMQTHLHSSLKSMERMAQQVPEGTLCGAINCSDNWIQQNILYYLGADKNLVVLMPGRDESESYMRMKQSLSLESGRYWDNMHDSSFFSSDFSRQMDCLIFWMADNIPVRYPAFAKAMLQRYAPIDSSGSDYPAIYIQQNQFPLNGWKHETELSLKRYFNVSGGKEIDSVYLDLLRIPSEEVPQGELVWIETSASLLEPVASAGDSIYLVVMTERNKQQLDHAMVGAGADSASLARGIHMKFRLREKLKKDDLVKLYIWNPDTVEAKLGKTLFRIHYFR